MSMPREFVGKYTIIMSSNGFPITVDTDLAHFLLLFKWFAKKDKKTHYAITNMFINKKNQNISMHRLISGMRNCQVDHRNRNGLDNTMKNLRFCTASQNSYNRVRKNSFGYRGVWKPKHSPYFAFQIQSKGKRTQKYGFKTAVEAAIAYDEANRRMHGEFGIRNFKD